VDRELTLDQIVLRTLAESPFIDARDWHSFRIAAVEAASFGPGAGSEFRVELPLTERAEASARQRSIAPTLQARKYWVLVVEPPSSPGSCPAAARPCWRRDAKSAQAGAEHPVAAGHRAVIWLRG
jgi:hypothetical protein